MDGQTKHSRQIHGHRGTACGPLAGRIAWPKGGPGKPKREPQTKRRSTTTTTTFHFALAECLNPSFLCALAAERGARGASHKAFESQCDKFVRTAICVVRRSAITWRPRCGDIDEIVRSQLYSIASSQARHQRHQFMLQPRQQVPPAGVGRRM
ncbi:hypothetical protein Mp_1g20930 [Marchantia polymorpha subsp. ruderalis]|uniref:Uncharacterized protein n=2 Tax=Marchantia polymorpha TaxID=3197 RepID=A0AAF6ASG8_MARPO|nr:hypothetical protein MARPO_0001s0428 [Marchantia polymorpha]BBM99388.1 hypothetical protein Mp_1g20930 [Marchantia polymorpha subsp. ruderalis]|eukprot:PTQ50464.1 hypothetical protein MARPO_0001s0428 [Marchantia polymorpha]